MDEPRVTLAKARLEAAQLRTRAAHQEDQAAAYRRQAAKPAYDGQAEICLGKAATVDALAAENRAKANLVDAEAEAAYKQATPPETRCYHVYRWIDGRGCELAEVFDALAEAEAYVRENNTQSGGHTYGIDPLDLPSDAESGT